MKQPRLVLIEWEDSAQPQSPWQWLEDYEPSGVVRIRSVGWLVHNGKDLKALAPNLGNAGTDSEQICGVIQIPTRCVRSLIVLDDGSES